MTKMLLCVCFVHTCNVHAACRKWSCDGHHKEFSATAGWHARPACKVWAHLHSNPPSLRDGLRLPLVSFCKAQGLTSNPCLAQEEAAAAAAALGTAAPVTQDGQCASPDTGSGCVLSRESAARMTQGLSPLEKVGQQSH